MPSSLRESARQDAIAALMRWATSAKPDERSTVHGILFCLLGMKPQHFDESAPEQVDDETLCRLALALELILYLKQTASPKNKAEGSA